MGGPKPAPPLQCLYLFATTLPGGVVGSVITMADPPLYEQYGIATRMWGLGVQTDQEIAGLMMWVGENTIYLILITIIFLRWANAEERKQDREDVLEMKAQIAKLAEDKGVLADRMLAVHQAEVEFWRTKYFEQQTVSDACGD